MANIAGLDAFKENHEKEVIDASQKVKIGIIGTGWIAESHVHALKQMPDVELQLSDGSIYSEKGRIESISGVIETSTGTVSLRAAFPNKGGLLDSGGSGNIILPHKAEGCIVIPQSATYEIQDKVYVFMYKDGVARSQIVGVFNISNGKEYVVESGLEKGDTIIVEGVGLLRDDMPIKIKDIVENKK